MHPPAAGLGPGARPAPFSTTHTTPAAAVNAAYAGLDPAAVAESLARILTACAPTEEAWLGTAARALSVLFSGGQGAYPVLTVTIRPAAEVAALPPGAAARGRGARRLAGKVGGGGGGVAGGPALPRDPGFAVGASSETVLAVGRAMGARWCAAGAEGAGAVSSAGGVGAHGHGWERVVAPVDAPGGMGLLVVQVGLGDEAGARAGPGTWGSLGGSPGSSLGGGVALGQALAWLAPFLVRGFEHAVTAPFRRRAALSGRVSESQRGVLIGLIEGKTEREIALAMERSPHTVHDHVKSIYGELGVSNRSQLQALWYGWGGEGEGSGGKAEW